MNQAPPQQMPMTPELESAIAALQEDPTQGREAALDALRNGSADIRLWIVAGQASRALEDWAGVEEAADGLLASAPNALLGLIWKGDCLSVRGEPRGAGPYYTAALRAAAEAGQLPEATLRELSRVERELEVIQQIYAKHLDDYLGNAGFNENNTSASFAEALSILAGNSSPSMDKQRPTRFYYPDLPQRSFYEREMFDWVERVEAATTDIRAELEPILAETANFRPYVTGDDDGPVRDYHGMKDNPEWTSYYLWDNGAPVEEHVARCPKTAELLATLPQPRFPDRSPTAMFSRLTPGARIPAHHGMLNVRLICHLPLIVPDGCGFRVGEERRDWEEGKLLIFDDSIEHEAWNSGDSDRVVLLFDIARPEIPERDREALAALFAAVDNFK